MIPACPLGPMGPRETYLGTLSRKDLPPGIDSWNLLTISKKGEHALSLPPARQR
jgi:hypothetical protein